MVHSDKDYPMAASSDPTSRPSIDWSQISLNIKPRPKPEIVIQPVEMEDGYSIFRSLSHKVAHCRYDVPLDHQVIVAYAHFKDSPTTDKAVGVITFWVSNGVGRDEKSFTFMDNYFHQISFLFVDQDYQRQGIGSQLLDAALVKIKRSKLDRPIHLEGAKSAISFFRRRGFISLGKAGCSDDIQPDHEIDTATEQTRELHIDS
ncbi:hypothetical protein RRG08_011000 [Elysia crispata]|uniref:N-acetyltransferase domain-containing protein n=1 Tax=Elysia crispata TaxID=231223 RepID=A0AAE1DKB3_9GAST|nr:hypothetical protein RRG08_011000 [Elysia crispata]